MACRRKPARAAALLAPIFTLVLTLCFGHPASAGDAVRWAGGGGRGPNMGGPPSAAERLDWLKRVVRGALRQLDANACGSEELHPCGGRDFSNGALAAYLLGDNANGSNASSRAPGSNWEN